MDNSHATNNPIKYILVAWLVAGSMDITAALTQFYIKTGKDSLIVLRYVASGVFGKSAMTGGNETAAWGLLFHYIVALGWTLLFFFLFPHINLFAKNLVVTGLLYGVLVWGMMTRVIVALTNVTQQPFNFKSAMIGMAILMVCIGLPISLIIGRYYSKRLG